MAYFDYFHTLSSLSPLSPSPLSHLFRFWKAQATGAERPVNWHLPSGTTGPAAAWGTGQSSDVRRSCRESWLWSRCLMAGMGGGRECARLEDQHSPTPWNILGISQWWHIFFQWQGCIRWEWEKLRGDDGGGFRRSIMKGYVCSFKELLQMGCWRVLSA